MKPEKVKLFKRSYLVLVVVIVFLINHAEIIWLSSRFNWEVADDMFILGKSVTTALIFLTWIFAIPLIIKIKNRFPYSKETKKNFFIHLLISIALSMVVDFIAELMTMVILYIGEKEYAMKYIKNYFDNIELYLLNVRFLSVLIYWLVLIYLSSVDYYLKYRSEALKRAEAESLIAKAELNALKMQIQPHFLFNTLHSISALIDEDKEEAQDVIGRLGELLRYTLDQHKNDFITLKTEIAFIENYLEVERARFKDRLAINYDIATDTEDIYIASFILQPLIENAIKHGLSKTNNPCLITIISRLEDNRLIIEISDNGNGSESIKKGVGLENTEQRLRSYYDKDYKFTYENLEPHGFQVIMQIPTTPKNDFA